MKEKINNYLYLSLAERRGLVVILFFVFVFFSAPLIFSFFEKKETTDFSEFLQEIKAFQNEKNILTASLNKPSPANNSVAALFYFDPNTVSKQDFVRLGLREKTAQTIVNYRQKGGRFFKAEDLKKVYGLRAQDYERLKPFIKIEPKEKAPQIAKNDIPKSYEHPEKSIPLRPSNFDPNTASEFVLLENGIPKKVVTTLIKFRSKGGSFKQKEDLKKIYGMTDFVFEKIAPFIQITDSPSQNRTIVKASVEKDAPQLAEYKSIKIDINKAAPEEWQLLRGIGPAYSQRIVKFRDKLGGFHSINQVSETYGLPDSTFQIIKAHLQVSPIFKKININQATVDILKQHPYIKWNQAKMIINYRNMHGNFSNVDDLLQIKALKKEWVEKIAPYLSTGG